MDYINVRNLEKYHPGYKDRELKWFKCYFKMVNADPEFEMLCEIDKWRFIALVMMQMQYQKPIPLDSNYLNRKGFDLKKRSMSLTLKMLHNSVDVVTEDEEPRDETVTKSKIRLEEDKSKNKNKKTVTEFPLELDTQVFRETWSEWVQYRKDIKKKLTPLSVKMQLKKLAKNPATAISIIEKSIQKGWTGLIFPEEENNERKTIPASQQKPSQTAGGGENGDRSHEFVR